MRSKLIAAVVVVVAALLLSTTSVGAQAAKLITGKDIKNNSVTGKDIKEKSLGTVPSAAKLSTLPSGKTQSGTFGAAGPAGAGDSGYLGFAINYPRPLATAIANDHIIDTEHAPDPTNCPAPGAAAPGYLCLYFDYHSGVDYVYGYSEDLPYSALPQSIGLGLYAYVTDPASAYVDGVWTVTAP